MVSRRLFLGAMGLTSMTLPAIASDDNGIAAAPTTVQGRAPSAKTRVLADHLPADPTAEEVLSLAAKDGPSSLLPDRIMLSGRRFAGDFGGGLYIKVAGEPLHMAKLQVLGEWYENREPTLTPQMLGAIGDGKSDDTDAMVSFFKTVSLAGRIGYVPRGIYPVRYADFKIESGLEVNLHPEAIIKGLPTGQWFDGDGITTDFNITEFPWHEGNITAVVVNADSTYKSLNAGSDFAILGAAIKLKAAPGRGARLRVALSKPIFTIRGKKDELKPFIWRGGIIDVSERAMVPSRSSGSGITLYYFEKVTVRDSIWRGQETWAACRDKFLCDTGLGINECSNVTICGNLFHGFGDLGIYITGNSSLLPFDDGENLSLFGNSFRHCFQGWKSVRQYRNATSFGNHYDRCYTGILNGLTGNEGAGRNLVIQGEQFFNMSRRAIDLRGLSGRVIISDVIIWNWGYNESDQREVDPTLTAIFLQGCPGATISNVTMTFEEGVDGHKGQRGIWLTALSRPDKTIVQNRSVSIRQVSISGATTGIVESGDPSHHADNVYEEITCENIQNEKIRAIGERCNWKFRNLDDGANWMGIGTFGYSDQETSWTPEVTVEGVHSTDVAYGKRQGTFIVRNGWCYATFQLECTIRDAVGDLRMRLPLRKDISPLLPVSGTASVNYGSGGNAIRTTLEIVVGGKGAENSLIFMRPDHRALPAQDVLSRTLIIEGRISYLV